MRSQFLTAVLAALVLPAAAASAPSRLFCEVTKNDGAFANQIFFEVEGNSARVVDGLILNEKGAPMAARISENTDKKLTLTWDVHITNRRGQQTKMAFRAAVLKPSNKLVLRAKPHGYSNTFNARGRCQSMQQELPGS